MSLEHAKNLDSKRLRCIPIGILKIVIICITNPISSDSESLFVKMATMAVHIGDSISSESYLRIDKVVKAALDTQSDGT